MKRYILLLSLFCACSPKIKKAEQKQYPFDVVEVLASGGFAGTTTGFSIQKNTEINVIYRKPNDVGNDKYYRSTSVDSVSMLFDKIMVSGIYDANFQKTGNMTYSISFRKDTSIRSIYWTDGLDSTENYVRMYRMIRDFASGRGKLSE